MKLSYDSLVALKVAFQMRLEYLEEQIKKAEKEKEKEKDRDTLAFWTDKHEKLVTAIQDLQEII
jgi:hypothetical protein